MADVHSVETRSYNMSRIRSGNTKPEMIVRRYLFAQGFPYRLHVKQLPGKPDIVLHKYKTIIFIHGCCWHGHYGCRYYVVPKTRTDWWLDKISKNQVNDEQNVNKLMNAGWKILTIWECELKKAIREQTLFALKQKLVDGA